MNAVTTANERVPVQIASPKSLRTAQAKLKRLVTGHRFLAGLKPQAYQLFCDAASLRRFNDGEEVFQQGGKADCFYLIESGQVVLEIFAPGRAKVVIQAVGPGEAFGWSWLFPPYQWHFSATAAKPTEAIAFEAGLLRERARQNQEFCYELVVRLAGVLTGRLEDVSTRLLYTYQGQR